MTEAVLGLYPPHIPATMLEYVPSPHMGRPEAAAGLVIFLASDASYFINGRTVSVDDGGLDTNRGLPMVLEKMDSNTR